MRRKLHFSQARCNKEPYQLASCLPKCRCTTEKPCGSTQQPTHLPTIRLPSPLVVVARSILSKKKEKKSGQVDPFASHPIISSSCPCSHGAAPNFFSHSADLTASARLTRGRTIELSSGTNLCWWHRSQWARRRTKAE